MVFNVKNDQGRVEYVVTLLFTRRVYLSRAEVAKAREYIESHWLDPFDTEKIALSSGMSRAQLGRLFKKHTGFTPRGYYSNYKISRLAETLKDKNISIEQAFEKCGMEYSSRTVRLFKQKYGIAPSVFRKLPFPAYSPPKPR
jgi:transcriptional regulator GlxA family with amidase domain